jgi:hypothetical protein
MSENSGYYPRRPDPEVGPDERYSFAAGSEPPAQEPDEPEEQEEKPKKKKKKKRRHDDDAGELKPEHKDHILDREEVPSAVPWWAMPAGIFLLGCFFLLGPLIFISIQEKDARIGLYGVIGLSVGVGGEVVAMIVLLMLVGAAFGIDYGHPVHAVVKLTALITYVNGQTLLVSMLCFPCASYFAILLAGMLAGSAAYGLFIMLFRLSVYESLLTVGGIVVSSWLLNFAVAGILGVGR